MASSLTRESKIKTIREAVAPSFASLHQGQSDIEAALRRRGEQIGKLGIAVTDLKETIGNSGTSEGVVIELAL